MQLGRGVIIRVKQRINFYRQVQNIFIFSKLVKGNLFAVQFLLAEFWEPEALICKPPPREAAWNSIAQIWQVWYRAKWRLRGTGDHHDILMSERAQNNDHIVFQKLLRNKERTLNTFYFITNQCNRHWWWKSESVIYIWIKFSVFKAPTLVSFYTTWTWEAWEHGINRGDQWNYWMNGQTNECDIV